MPEEPLSTPDLSSLGMDLARSFQPSWVKENTDPAKLSKLAERFDADPRPRDGRDARRGPRDAKGDRRDFKPRGDRQGPRERNQKTGGKPHQKPRGGHDRRETRPEDRQPKPVVLQGWEVRFLPESRGLDGLARQIKTLARAYPLFDLARLVLDQAERYQVELKPFSESPQPLFQYLEDKTLWTSENTAIHHVLHSALEKFYQRERVQIGEPKGNYAFIAECDGVLLGPPNHHEYQGKLKQLHAAKFARLPFEAFKNRVRILRDEETLARWKEEQSFRDEFVPLHQEGEPTRLVSMEDVERHFRTNHLSTQIVPVKETLVVPGPAAIRHSAAPVLGLVREANDALMKFPLPLAHEIGQALAAQGLQIFKSYDKVTYVSIARPHALDRSQNLAEGVRQILDYLSANPKVPRAEQWKALLALRPIPEGGDEKSRESAMAADLSWLLREGHVIDFANRGLEVVKPKPPKEEKSAEGN